MSKRRNAAQIQRILREVERDRVKGLTLGDICRKRGVSENTYHRWRRVFDPAVVDDARRVRELEGEVDARFAELQDAGGVQRRVRPRHR